MANNTEQELRGKIFWAFNGLVLDGTNKPIADLIDAKILPIIEVEVTKAKEEEHNAWAGSIFAMKMVGESRAADAMLEALKARKAKLAELKRQAKGGK